MMLLVLRLYYRNNLKYEGSIRINVNICLNNDNIVFSYCKVTKCTMKIINYT